MSLNPAADANETMAKLLALENRTGYSKYLRHANYFDKYITPFFEVHELSVDAKVEMQI